MREWWDALATRERLILGAGAALTALLLLWALLWQPLVSEVRRMETEVAAQRENLRWMQAAAAELQQLRGSGAPAAGLAGRSLLGVADQSARSAGLGTGLKRIEPDGADAVRVRLEGVSFDTVVLWLDGLARQSGVTANSVTVERTEAPGLVNVRLTLQAGVS